MELENFVIREDWGAKPYNRRSNIPSVDSLTAHYVGVDLNYTATTPKNTEVNRVQRIQNDHMEGNGWSDIAYNFLIGQTGTIFEGRGLGIRSAAQGTNAGNDTSYACCFLIGPTDVPTYEAIESWKHLRQYVGQEKVRVHSDWKATACPGDSIRRLRDVGELIKDPVVQQEEDAGCCGDELTRERRIRWLQAALSRLTIDGQFGPKTEARFNAHMCGDRSTTPAEVDRMLINKPAVVRWIQREVNAATETSNPVKLDGAFGNRTRQLIAEFDPTNSSGIVTASVAKKLLGL